MDPFFTVITTNALLIAFYGFEAEFAADVLFTHKTKKRKNSTAKMTRIK
jgi:hypothetical protein